MKLHSEGMVLLDGQKLLAATDLAGRTPGKNMARKLLGEPGEDSMLHLHFDALISHDITYVGIIQTARASGLSKFPLPYVLTNCHNSLCAVGGTINEDDHAFGLSAAKKYGGIYVPANQAVIHQYAREKLSRVGAKILGSDSHTRYGALGTMGFGEGGPELVKQLLGDTYDFAYPETVLIYLTGALKPGIGPHDVALALCAAVFPNGFVKNRVLEFAGPGLSSLSAEERIGIDVMTTETACLTSIWQTDDTIKAYYENHGRAEDFAYLAPDSIAYYDRCVELNLSEIQSMIALPYHPSKAFPIAKLCTGDYNASKALLADAAPELIPLLDEKGYLHAAQGEIAGCAGGLYENIAAANCVLSGTPCSDFTLNVYPASMPQFQALSEEGIITDLVRKGIAIKPCFCGPCFGAGDVPANGTLSLRHTTRNFPNREGSKPDQGQKSFVALMDARSIAASAANGGIVTPADSLDPTIWKTPRAYTFSNQAYAARVYDGFGKALPDTELVLGPNITDWPALLASKKHMLLRFASILEDEVTTTDELIPSGETSSYRSNPLKLAEFALSRRDPAYVGTAKEIAALSVSDALRELHLDYDATEVTLGSVIFAKKPGDGSAREQAASCQRILGTLANVSYEYATKRYRSNLINWGLLPFTCPRTDRTLFEKGGWLFIPELRDHLRAGAAKFDALYFAPDGSRTALVLSVDALSPEERRIILNGCLMNDYKEKLAK